jgi:diguanylate cyclase (GGDEF)-like protein
MIAPAQPENEQERLASLQSLRVLDTEPEERFDRVTRLARKIFDVPIAVISLVDENRQWFKSCCGLEAKETSREVSFCGHTIHHNHPFIVEDALQDKRFFDNPLVINEPYIRFYAGHPVAAPTGENIGTVCIIDTKIRTLSSEDITALTDLAGLVTAEFMSSQLATMDELTNIANRRGFKCIAQHCMNMAARQEDNCYLVYFDLNNFKLFNDNYGHAIGDQVLKVFSEQMKSTFRTSDICARLGGDEFTVLLTDTQLETAQQAIKRFASNLRTISTQLDLPYQISFSHGMVSFDKSVHFTVEHLIAEADDAMYQDKHRQ